HMTDIVFGNVSRLAILIGGFAAGVALVMSCGKGNGATAQSAQPITALHITTVHRSGTTASCPLNSFVVGGGCVNVGTPCQGPTNSEQIHQSAPLNTTTWACDMTCGDGTPTGSQNTFAICVDVTPSSGLSAS